ncbi:hypothetical protein FTV88_1069 [Heliorestis convoluta]|uniref:Uncharacterized protein n=1 Tax=Heliorestis convoluta TaxID=356322 RepID=A0A5Q2MYZ0_9FIRM|nr:hypothetical protein FTV88_1069 [Heliorestis convoluta]
MRCHETSVAGEQFFLFLLVTPMATLVIPLAINKFYKVI